MRQAKTNDYWKKIKEIKHNSYIIDINLNGYNGFGEVTCEKGIQIICGLNGAGKTTLFSGIKDIIGISLDEQGAIKIKSANISGNIMLDGEKYYCENSQGKRLVDQIDCVERIGVLEYFQIFRTLDWFWKQDNLDELLEQNELIDLGKTDMEEINYLIGREYAQISLVEIEDVYGNNTIPFFSVRSEGICYDSRKMGMGEYCLMYIYWYIRRAKENAIILIEEPESFVSIKSQKNLMNFVVKNIITKKISFIISTHSPFIIEKVSNKNICVISRAIGTVSVRKPIDKQVNKILGSEENIKGTFLVEDEMAYNFLHIMLRREDTDIFRNYSIKIAGSSGEITKAMKIGILNEIEYHIVGIYDDDQRGQNLEDNKLVYTFLPPEKDVESEMKKMILEGNILEDLSDGIKKTKDEIIEAISQVNGEDHHDWLRNLADILNLRVYCFLEVLYVIWRERHEEVVKKFMKELRDITHL